MNCSSVLRGTLLGTALLLAAAAAPADPVAVINALRTEGCGRVPPAGAAVRPDAALDDIARAMSATDRLEQAFDEGAYPAASATSFHVRGSRADEAIRQILAARYCDALSDPRYEDIGVFARGDDTWIVLAVRQIAQPRLEPSAVAERALELVNAARAEARQCGRERFAAAAPLTLSARLNEAALAHAQDMAARGRTGHRGSDGSQSGDRITRAGYAWRAAAENVAAGQPDAESVVAAWLGSPGHCANIMRPYFTQMGVAFALAPGRDPAIYWAQVFAAPL